jgi:hypothetical protein
MIVQQRVPRKPSSGVYRSSAGDYIRCANCHQDVLREFSTTISDPFETNPLCMCNACMQKRMDEEFDNLFDEDWGDEGIKV